MASRASTARRSVALVLGLALAAAVAITAARAAGAVDGTYTETSTVYKTCPFGPPVSSEENGAFAVTQQGSQLTISTPDGTLTGTIQPDLTFHVTAEGTTFDGQFSLSEGGSFTGTIVIAFCGSQGSVTSQVRGYRVGGEPGPSGPSPSVGPSPSEEAPSPAPSPSVDAKHLPGYTEGVDLFDIQLCPPDARSAQYSLCAQAEAERAEWVESMREGVGAVGGSSEVLNALNQVVAIVGQAAALGSLLAPGANYTSCERFPILKAILPAFGKVFVQAVNAAASGDLAAVEKARDAADRLLSLTLGVDQTTAPGTGDCP